MSWILTTIGEQCTVTSSKRFHLSERTDKGVPFYCSKEIIQKYMGEEVTACDFISEKLYTEVAEKYGVPKTNDLLVTTRGTIGVPYLYRSTDRFYFADGNLTWMKDFKETLLPQYLYYWFLTHESKNKLDAIAKGTAQKAAPIAGIKSLEILLPSVDVQCRIVDVLSAYDTLIENNQKQIKLLEEAAQRLYKEWFVDRRFPGHETTPIVDGVPEGWHESTVDDCSCILRRGISPKYSEDGPSIVINQKCIRRSVVDLNEARRQEKQFLPEMNLIDSDTVICSTGAGTLGRVGQIFGQQPNTTFDSHVTLVRASDIVGKQYLYQFLKSEQQYLQGRGKGSTNQLELNRATIQKLVLLVPSTEIRDTFECQAQPIHDQITTLSKQIVLLQEARDKLLPKLMNGEMEK